MMDQAEKLRSIINSLNNIKPNSEGAQEGVGVSMKKKTRVITVTSGKGGVGKTNISINLGLVLSELGNRVVVIDADFGLANVDVVLGIMPEYNLLDVIKDDKEIVDILTEGPNGIKFISGGSGVEELIKLEKWQLDKFLEKMSQLDDIADIIIIDTGAGLSENVLSFVMSADEIILVTTPEPTSITDAYALIKMVSKMDKNKNLKIIVNRAEDSEEAGQILKKLTLAAEKFLSFKIAALGFVLNDNTVTKSVKQQQPFVIGYPKCTASKYIREIANKLIKSYEEVSAQPAGGIRSFVGRLMRLLNV
jgi:flagellar biosynthesis protein FlhG